MADTQESSDEWLDILGSQALLKKVVRKGDGRESRPQKGDTVLIRTTVYVNSVVTEQESDISFRVGESDVPPAWDLVVPLMELHEQARVRAHYRFDKRPGTKEDSSIEYDIELVHITLGKDLEEMTPEEILDVGKTKRLRGCDWVRAEEFDLASTCFKKALEFLEHEAAQASHLRDLIREQQLKCLTNLAIVYSKLSLHAQTMEMCSRALSLDPKHVKAVFQLAKAKLAVNCPEEAVDIITKLDAPTPDDAASLHGLLREARMKISQNKRSEKDLYTRMASALVKEPSSLASSTDPAPAPGPASMTSLVLVGMLGAAMALGVSMISRLWSTPFSSH